MARKNRLKKRKFKAAQIYSVSDNLDNVVSVAPMMKAGRQTESQLLSAQRQETSAQIDSMIASHNQARDNEATARSELSSAALATAARDAVANIAAARDAATAAVAIASALGALAVREAGEQLAANAKAAADKGIESAKSAVAAEAEKTGALADAKTAAAEAAEQQAAINQQTAQLATAAKVAALNNAANAVAAAAVTALSAAQVAAGNAAMAAFMNSAAALNTSFNQLRSINWTKLGITPQQNVCIYTCVNHYISKGDTVGICHENKDDNKMFGFYFDGTKNASLSDADKTMCGATLDIGKKDDKGKLFVYFKDIPVFFVHWINNFTLGTHGLANGTFGLNQDLKGAKGLKDCLKPSVFYKKYKLSRDNDNIDVRIYVPDSSKPNLGKAFWYGIDANDIDDKNKTGSESTLLQTTLLDFLNDYIPLFGKYFSGVTLTDAQQAYEQKEILDVLANKSNSNYAYWSGSMPLFYDKSTTIREVP